MQAKLRILLVMRYLLLRQLFLLDKGRIFFNLKVD
jgi:hypothetical protein